MLEGKNSWGKKTLRLFKEPSGTFQEVFHNDVIDGSWGSFSAHFKMQSFQIIVVNSQTARENRKIF